MTFRHEPLPITDNDLPFPAGDISRTSPEYERVVAWLDQKEMGNRWTNTSTTLAFTDINERNWLNDATPTQSVTYYAALGVVKQWDRDNVPNATAPLFAQRGLRFAHAMSAYTNLLPIDYPNWAEELDEMRDTFMGDETKKTNRALLFGAAAWANMQSHQNVLAIYTRMSNYIATLHAMTKYQKNVLDAGFGLHYTMSVHSRFQTPMSSVTGLRISPALHDARTDTDIFTTHGELSDERNYDGTA